MRTIRPQAPRAVTLIELLIVAALVSVLATLALPNFLEAHTRSRVARSRADLAATAQALETYAVDHGGYPLNGALFVDGSWQNPQLDQRVAPAHKFLTSSLTTPVAYLHGLIEDPFILNRPLQPDWEPYHSLYFYTNLDWFTAITQPTPPPVIELMRRTYGTWILAGAGPDGDRLDLARHVFYDPTNGTLSDGDLIRSPRRAE